jgi:tetratricopeptide (TPR) repeat protein
MFAEAWYNLSDLLDEQGRSQAAVDCLRRALEAAPDYADAMFNLALLLQRNNKHAEAVEYRRRYLANDAQSEWAARAPKILRNATATLLIAAVFQVAACNGPRCPWRGRTAAQRVLWVRVAGGASYCFPEASQSDSRGTGRPHKCPRHGLKHRVREAIGSP